MVYEVLLIRLRPERFERSILVTLGLSIIVIHVMQYPLHRDAASGRYASTRLRGVEIGSIHHLDAHHRCCSALAAFARFYGVLRYTQFGRAMRAIAQNREVGPSWSASAARRGAQMP